MGAFIVLEGGEGAGKTTAVAAVREYLASRGVSPGDILETREPGGTEIAERIRGILKEPNPGEKLTDESELLLMYAARSQLVERVIKPAVAAGKYVIGDRHDLSTEAYQGAGRGIAPAKIAAIRAFAIGDFTPDLTIVMDIAPEEGMKRARSRGAPDRFELEDSGFFRRVRECFLAAARRNPDKIAVIDAGGSLEEVKRALFAALDGAGVCTAG